MKRPHGLARAPRCAPVAGCGRVFVSATLGALASCESIPLEPGTIPPAGVLQGTLVYQGQAPCTRRGVPVGGAVLLVTPADAPPPPAGLAVSPAQFGSVPGTQLFADALGALPAGPDDALVCPTADAPPVLASTSWQLGPVPAGRYQITAFYDRDGDFSPVLGTHSQPDTGDVGGGVIDNPVQVLAGLEAPVFRATTVGHDRDGDGVYTIPDDGEVVDNVIVTLGLPVVTPRPIFHVREALDERPARPAAAEAGLPALSTDERIAFAPAADPLNAEKLFLRLRLGPSVPEAELDRAAARPYGLNVRAPADQFYLSPLTDAQGGPLLVPEAGAAPVAAIFPQALFLKADERVAPPGRFLQTAPLVALPGITLRNGLFAETLVANFVDASGAPLPPQSAAELTVAVRPAALCLSTDPRAPVYFVTPSFTTSAGETLVDPEAIVPGLRALLGRPDADVRVVEGCLPRGRYQINLLSPSGQRWAVPNEAGLCVAPEISRDNDTACVEEGYPARTKLVSQAAFFTVGAEREAAYCASLHPGDDLFVAGVPRACLRPDEAK